MDRMLTRGEFFDIYCHLYLLSDTWAELWMALHLTGVSPSLLLQVKYKDIVNGNIYLKGYGRFQSMVIPISDRLQKLIDLRIRRYPTDIYIFQSHSNVKKNIICPVTLIAFNQALKKTSGKVTNKKVSSKCAYKQNILF